MENTYETLTVTVLKERAPELLAFAGTLAHPRKEEEAADPDGATPIQLVTNGSSKASVISAYRGGESEYWPLFLVALARASLAAVGTVDDGWVRWEALYSAIGLAPRNAAGMLGAAERRCRHATPYEKTFEGGYWFRMTESVANLILQLGAEDQPAA